jgi:glycine reductase complex component B subunit gamma
VCIMLCGVSVAGMNEIVPRLAQFALKLGRREAIGSAHEEGYLPKGLFHNARGTRPALERAAGMLLAKLCGQPFRTEIPQSSGRRVPAPPPLDDLRTAAVAVVTERERGYRAEVRGD